MALTKTIDVGLNTNTSMRSFISRGGDYEIGTLAFDSSYPLGGESLTFDHELKHIEIEPQGGYTFEYDHTNKKVKVFRPGQSLIIEESVTAASNVGTLKHKPFYILAIDVTATTTTGPYNVIPKGRTPLTTECAVDFTTGGLTFLTGDAVTAARVTYIPLHETGPFSSSNLVVDEAVTATIAKTNLAYQAAAVQYVYNTTPATPLRMILEPVGEAPTASGNAVIDINDTSDGTDVDCHDDDKTDVFNITYIKYGTFKPYAQLGDGDLTLDSSGGIEAYNFTAHHYGDLAIPGLGTQMVGEANTTVNVEHIWSGPSVSLAASVPTLEFELNQWRTNEATAITTLAVPIIFISALTTENAKLELATGTSLAALTSVKYKAIGY